MWSGRHTAVMVASASTRVKIVIGVSLGGNGNGTVRGTGLSKSACETVKKVLSVSVSHVGSVAARNSSTGAGLSGTVNEHQIGSRSGAASMAGSRSGGGGHVHMNMRGNGMVGTRSTCERAHLGGGKVTRSDETETAMLVLVER
jgi:hypothetical protein